MGGRIQETFGSLPDRASAAKSAGQLGRKACRHGLERGFETYCSKFRSTLNPASSAMSWPGPTEAPGGWYTLQETPWSDRTSGIVSQPTEPTAYSASCSVSGVCSTGLALGCSLNGEPAERLRDAPLDHLVTVQ